ncbi:MAG: hypothetical protein BWZ07_03085 [Alphaproteobacteria bacterium ADurb.BinA280]|nr:MAG: hypothetical protein BWZ07_03085 [Alphaproteobacteria bacterium ADurb.BinA280]
MLFTRAGLQLPVFCPQQIQAGPVQLQATAFAVGGQVRNHCTKHGDRLFVPPYHGVRVRQQSLRPKSERLVAVLASDLITLGSDIDGTTMLLQHLQDKCQRQTRIRHRRLRIGKACRFPRSRRDRQCIPKVAPGCQNNRFGSKQRRTPVVGADGQSGFDQCQCLGDLASALQRNHLTRPVSYHVLLIAVNFRDHRFGRVVVLCRSTGRTAFVQMVFACRNVINAHRSALVSAHEPAASPTAGVQS